MMSANEEHRPEPPDARGAIVTLVHGTWGRGFFPKDKPTRPVWSSAGSSFRDELHRALVARGVAASFVEFRWPGDNSALVRDDAARRLAEALDAQADSEPAKIQVVIGHSHGGNIALDAARHHRRSRSPIHVVALATPFLDIYHEVKGSQQDQTEEWIRASDRAERRKEVKITLLSLLLTYFACAALAWFGLSLFDLRTIVQDGIGFRLIAPLAILTIVGLVLNSLSWRYEDAVEDTMEKVVLFDTPPCPGAKSVQTLVLRGTDDEAALLLAAGSIVSLLTSRIGRRCEVILSAVATFWAGILAVLLWLSPDYARDKMHFLKTTIALGLLFLTLSGLEALGRAAFGREFFFGSSMFRINVNSAPDAAADMAVHTLLGQRGRRVERLGAGHLETTEVRAYRYWLRHKLYEHEDCVRTIAAWLADRVEADTPVEERV